MADLGDLIWADGVMWIYCGDTLKWGASSKDGLFAEGWSKKQLKKFDDYCLIVKNGEFVIPKKIAAAYREGYEIGQKDGPYMFSWH